MKKKLLTLLTLLVVCVTGTWAQGTAPDFETSDWGSNDFSTVIANHGSITLLASATSFSGNFSGTQYIALSGGSDGYNGNYFGIKATSVIEKISVYYCANGSSATNLAVIGWKENTEPSSSVDYMGTTTGIAKDDAGKSLDKAIWEDIDLSSENLTQVHIARQFKNIYVNGTKQSNFGNNATVNVLGVKVWLKPAAPTITNQPQSASYASGQTIEALTVVATGTGTLTYQWYKCDDANKTNAEEIDDETNDSYTPNAAGFYFVRVTDSNGSVDSDVAEITVSSATAPTITVSGAPADAVKIGTEITLTATVTGVPTPTIQWYRNTTASNTGGTAIDGETNPTYSPSTADTGTFYFYAVASNSQGDVPSAVQTIVVKEQVATPTFDPNGAYFQDSQEVTLDCATADATIQYSTDGGTTWTDYTAPLTFDATTTVQAKATKDGYIDSEVATATFTLVTLDEQTDVTGATTWDWSTVTNDSNIDFGDEGAGSLRNVDVLFSNIPKYGKTAVTALAAFDQTALLMNGQRPYANANGSKHCQVNYLKFNTTVSGWVTVEYSNTGSNAARTVNVNGTKGSKPVANNTDYVSETFAVSAGTVTIKGVQVSDDADKMLRIRKVTFTPPVTVTATKQYSTFCSTYDLDFSNVSGLEAYVVSELTSTAAKISKVSKVPAGTGLILKKTANVGTATDFTVPIATTNASVGTNYLVGVTADKSMDNEANAYILSNGEFYKCSGGTLAAGKAYLDATGTAWAGSTAPSFSIEGDGDATGIRPIDNEQLIMDNVIYDLNGRRIENPTKGVYIMNGKKVVIK